jgi:AhpC/TSA family
MLQKLVALLFALLTIVPSGADREGKELKMGAPAPEFALKDSHGKEHSLEKLLHEGDTSNKMAILVMGNSEVRKEAGKWAIELDKVCRKNKDVAALMVADLRGKPFFVTEGMVKRHIKRANPPVPIVLDRDGAVNKLYKVQRNKANIFIVDRDGRVCYRKSGSYSEELVGEIQGNVWNNLEKPMLSMGKNDYEARERIIAGIKP